MALLGDARYQCLVDTVDDRSVIVLNRDNEMYSHAEPLHPSLSTQELYGGKGGQWLLLPRI